MTENTHTVLFNQAGETIKENRGQGSCYINFCGEVLDIYEAEHMACRSEYFFFGRWTCWIEQQLHQ